jgi:trehalose/maltose hydrolase-like predicted phosphorylase
LSLSSTFTNKNILNTLKATNEAFKNISVNIKEIEDAIETSKENLENYRDVNNILSQGNEDDEELLKEFESLDQLELPSVPSYSIKPKEKEEVRQPEYILNS